jgi:hypothetical protein
MASGRGWITRASRKETITTKLTDTQLNILSAAAQRPNGNLLPLPGSLRGGTATKVVAALLARGFIRKQIINSPRKADAAMNTIWRNLPEPDGRGVLLLQQVAVGAIICSRIRPRMRSALTTWRRRHRAGSRAVRSHRRRAVGGGRRRCPTAARSGPHKLASLGRAPAAGDPDNRSHCYRGCVAGDMVAPVRRLHARKRRTAPRSRPRKRAALPQKPPSPDAAHSGRDEVCAAAKYHGTGRLRSARPRVVKSKRGRPPRRPAQLRSARPTVSTRPERAVRRASEASASIRPADFVVLDVPCGSPTRAAHCTRP